jgi:hypothetical protein
MHIIGRTLVLKILYLKCSWIYPVGLSDFDQTIRCSDYPKFHRTLISVFGLSVGSKKIGLSNDLETPKFNGTWVSVRWWNSCFKNNGISDMTSDSPIDRIVRNSPEFRPLARACLGVKKTSDYPMSPRKVRGGMKRVSPNGHFLGDL